MRHLLRVVGIVVGAALLAACQTTAEKAPVTRAFDGGITHVSRTVPVASGANVAVDIYLPASPSPAPGVFVLPTYYVNVFGKSEAPDRDYALALARRGYAAIVPALTQYGLRAYHPGHSADMLSLSAWFRGLPEVMDDRIAAVGFSAGSHQAGVLAIADPTARAVIAYYGAHDSARFNLRAEDGATSPFRHAPRMNGRVLILHGDADNETPLADAQTYRDALVAAGKPVELVVYPGAFHRYDRGPSDVMGGREVDRAGHVYRLDPAARDDSWRRTLELLDRTMR
jgi:carboxymethylenebutenolidase